ncbi:WhiB family transcriptional regulator [Nonomuraea endophytica]|uniref:WhiB family transcriptional regulator n=1 Tax=Nonomuraea endophytica TaxID=714136 RepID=UPI0037C852F4
MAAPASGCVRTAQPPVVQLGSALDCARRELAERVAGKSICTGQDDELFFEAGLHPKRADALCAGCDVREDCFRLAVIDEAVSIVRNRGSVQRDVVGVRGGRTSKARRPHVTVLVRQLRTRSPGASA